jgi:hypothetical protein
VRRRVFWRPAHARRTLDVSAGWSLTNRRDTDIDSQVRSGIVSGDVRNHTVPWEPLSGGLLSLWCSRVSVRSGRQRIGWRSQALSMPALATAQREMPP